MYTNDKNDNIRLNGEHSTTKPKKGKLPFFIWLIISIAALAFCVWKGSFLSILAMFQILLGVAVATFIDAWKSKKFFHVLEALPVVLIALYMFMIFFVIAFGDNDIQTMYLDCIPYVFSIIAIISGLSMLGFTYFKTKHLKDSCVVPIEATCVKLDSRYRSSSKSHSFCPVFAFEYGGKSYEVCDNEYSYNRNITLGQHYTIMINPENPNEFSDAKVSYSSNYILGILYLGIGSYILYQSTFK